DGALRSPGLDSAQIQKYVARFTGPDYRSALEQATAPMFPSPADSVLRQRMVRIAQSTPQPAVVGAMRAMLDPAIWRDDPIAVPLVVVVAKKTGWPADYRRFLKSISRDVRYEELDGV